MPRLTWTSWLPWTSLWRHLFIWTPVMKRKEKVIVLWTYLFTPTLINSMHFTVFEVRHKSTWFILDTLNRNIPRALAFLVYLDFHFPPYSPGLRNKTCLVLPRTYNETTFNLHQITDHSAVGILVFFTFLIIIINFPRCVQELQHTFMRFWDMAVWCLIVSSQMLSFPVEQASVIAGWSSAIKSKSSPACP